MFIALLSCGALASVTVKLSQQQLARRKSASEPRAKSYSDAIRTRLPINHFLFAPDPHARWCGEGVREDGHCPI